MEADDGQQRRGQGRADQVFQVVGKLGQRQGAGVFGLVRQHVRDGGLERRREGGRGGLQDEDQHVHLPDRIHKRQADRNGGAHQVEADEHGPPGELIGEGAGHGRHADIGHHLDRERRAQHGTGLSARELVCDQPERDGGKPSAEQGDDLGGEQVAVGAGAEGGKHGHPLPQPPQPAVCLLPRPRVERPPTSRGLYEL